MAVKYVTEPARSLAATGVRSAETGATKALGYLRGSAAVFGLTVLVCAALLPADILGHYGLSFYGNFSRTFVPYTIGLLVTAYGVIRACQELRSVPDMRGFRPALQAIAAALLGVIVTPSLFAAWLVQDLHVLFGLVLFGTQFGLSVYYLVRVQREWVDWALVALQLLAIALVLLSFRALDIMALMLPAQLLAIGSFSTLLARAISRQTLKEVTTNTAKNV